jgi:two-component system alkaline phosphatase synthesis response regulator PhoP
MATKVLVVDDEADTLHLLEVKFKKAGYEVLTAAGGDEGIEKSHQEVPDVVVLDLLMPGINGLEVCQKIKEGMASPPLVVMLSAKRDIASISAAFTTGVDDYMTKPFSPHSLTERVRILLIKNGRYPQ